MKCKVAKKIDDIAILNNLDTVKREPCAFDEKHSAMAVFLKNRIL